jgi:hypothetical protein
MPTSICRISSRSQFFPIYTTNMRKQENLRMCALLFQCTFPAIYIHTYIHTHQWLYSPFVGPWPLLQFRNLFTQTVGLFGRVISPSQGLCLYTGQHKHRINALTNIHASSRIRIYDPSVRTSEDSSCLRPPGYPDRLLLTYTAIIMLIEQSWKRQVL